MKYIRKTDAHIAIGKSIILSSIMAIICTCEKVDIVAIIKISTDSVTNESFTSCTVTGTIIDKGEKGIDQHGFSYSLSEDPSIAKSDPYKNLGSRNTTGTFTTTLTGLSDGKKYFIRAYAQNKDGTVYGEQLSCWTIGYKLPTVNIAPINYTDGSTAQCGGNVTDDGGKTVTARGVCWDTEINPELSTTIGDNNTQDGSGTGSFVSTLTQLEPNITYYVRAYATNSIGTSYSSQERNFKTDAIVPTVTTTSVSNITRNSAQSGGSVLNNGGSPVTTRGVCWHTSSNPNIYHFTTTNGSGLGSFASNLMNLNANTQYWVRAYATNIAGTGYGDPIPFTTESFVVGEIYGGGIIFYVDGTGKHGLIAPTSNHDQSTGTEWGCNGITIGGTSTDIGTGNANTIAIVNGCTDDGIAAEICYNSSHSGYNDWYLPSFHELNLLYEQRALFIFADALYWSSSEVNSLGAWAKNLTTGFSFSYQNKDHGAIRVRAIRSF